MCFFIKFNIIKQLFRIEVKFPITFYSNDRLINQGKNGACTVSDEKNCCPCFNFQIVNFPFICSNIPEVGFVLLHLQFFVQYFVDHCLSFCPSSFGHYMVCPLNYGFLLHFGIFKLFLTRFCWVCHFTTDHHLTLPITTEHYRPPENCKFATHFMFNYKILYAFFQHN